MAEVVKAATAAGRPIQVLEKFDAPTAPTIDPRTGQGKPFNDYTFGTQAVEVEIDEETGALRATRLVACYDVGQAINRQSLEGQIEGGAIQGLGHVTEAVVLEDGISRNPHLFDYKIPTTLDSPHVETVLVESGNGLGPFGAKGIGEPAMTPTPAAVMNAVSRALGRRVTRLPITPERIHRRPPGGRVAAPPMSLSLDLHAERPPVPRRGAAALDGARPPPRRALPRRHQGRLRRGRVRGLYRAPGRRARAGVPHAGGARPRPRAPDHRGPGGQTSFTRSRTPSRASAPPSAGSARRG